MKKITLGLLLAVLVVLGVSQVAYASPAGDGPGYKNCIAWCVAGKVEHGTIYRGPVIGTVSVSDFARDHNPSDSTAIDECKKMAGGITISELEPPQPQP